MKAYVGTSGYAYKEWKGPFYPEDLRNDGMLRYYGERLNSVEINNTFYRMPRESVLRQWGSQVADGFRFVLKASRRITHFKRLKDAGDELMYLLQASSVLGNKLGPTLFQLPPNLKKDAERLGMFIQLLPPRWKAAVEFRHDSWLDEETFEILRSREIAVVAAETDGGLDVPVVSTAPWGYLRLRKESYDDAELERWIETIREHEWREVYVYFKHEDAAGGPLLAEKFRALASSPTEES